MPQTRSSLPPIICPCLVGALLDLSEVYDGNAHSHSYVGKCVCGCARAFLDHLCASVCVCMSMCRRKCVKREFVLVSL